MKKSILYLAGAQFSKNFQSLNDFSFFEEKDIEKLILNKYDINTKLLFSGINSNILSTHGKLLEIEELFLLTHLSIDYNILIYSNQYRVIGTRDDEFEYVEPLISNDIIDNIYSFGIDDESEDYSKEDFIITEQMALNFLNHSNSFDLNKKFYNY
jgi:hypothetical protein